MQCVRKARKLTGVRSHDDGSAQVKIKARSSGQAIERIGINDHWAIVILSKYANHYLCFGKSRAHSGADHQDIGAARLCIECCGHCVRNKVTIAIHCKRNPGGRRVC